MREVPLWLWLYLAGALLIPGRPLYTGLYLLGGTYLLARLSLTWGLRRLKVERLLSDERLFAGESLTVTLRFTNPTGAPIPWLQLIESRPAGLAPQPLTAIVAVKVGGQAELSYTLPTYRRGRYALGPLAWSAGDPFGFTRAQGGIPEQTRVTVYPRISPLPELGLPARLPMGELAAGLPAPAAGASGHGGGAGAAGQGGGRGDPALCAGGAGPGPGAALGNLALPGHPPRDGGGGGPLP